MANSIKIAVVGTGYFSQFHFDAWDRLSTSVGGICSLNYEQAERVSAKFPGCRSFSDYKLMMDEIRPDLIDIIVPPSEQAYIIKEAIDRGINIICQKPFTTCLKEAEKVGDISALKSILKDVVPGFKPEEEIVDVIHLQKNN